MNEAATGLYSGRASEERMSTSDAPDQQPETSEQEQTERQPGSSSRWINYDTHELLDMISELEDERRWARLREGALWAVLAHLILISAVTWIPRYVFKVPLVVENKDKSHHDDFTYLDSPMMKAAPKVKPMIKPPTIDKQTLDDIRKQAPPVPAQQQPQQQTQSQPQQQAPVPPPPQQQQSQMEAPRPAAVPARPNFAALGAQQSQLQAMHDAAHGMSQYHGSSSGGSLGGSHMHMHPGAGEGGVEVLSDTQGVDFSAWLHAWHFETEKTWDPLIPDEVNPPIYKSGQVMIRFKVLPNGRLMDGSLILEGRSGDVALDRAAWGALTGSNYPGLPHDFHGPYLELRALFLYNEKQ
ncbi:energy transducer TonB family protein [Telmatobacter bradus]|uniref:energy transducer TonB family protein n=1 Tax=Telmatobacter bradus TaxID=474953 RepID=UPI003B436E1A